MEDFKMEELYVTVDSLYYTVIEHEILNFYDMGYANSSSLPHLLKINDVGTYTIRGTKKYGSFHISVHTHVDGKIYLHAMPQYIKNTK
jgi:hypothetical protein